MTIWTLLAATVLSVIIGLVIFAFSVSLKNVKSAEERRYIIKWTLIFLFIIGSFIAAILTVPPERKFLIWIIYIVVLPVAIRLSKREDKKPSDQ